MITFLPGEFIKFKIRKHWLFLVQEILFAVVFTLLPFIGWIAYELWPQAPAVNIPGNSIALAVALSAMWLLISLPFIAVVWTDYYLDVLLITNRRLIDIEQKRLFSREISVHRLDRVQDITTEISGVIPTLLGFGTLHVQTAGERQKFLLHYIPRPDAVKAHIYRIVAELHRNENKKESGKIEKG